MGISTLTKFDYIEWIILACAVIVVILSGLVKYNLHLRIDEYLGKTNIVFRWLVLFVLLFAIIIVGIYGPAYDASAFIYFQF